MVALTEVKPKKQQPFQRLEIWPFGTLGTITRERRKKLGEKVLSLPQLEVGEMYSAHLDGGKRLGFIFYGKSEMERHINVIRINDEGEPLAHAASFPKCPEEFGFEQFVLSTTALGLQPLRGVYSSCYVTKFDKRPSSETVRKNS